MYGSAAKKNFFIRRAGEILIGAFCARIISNRIAVFSFVFAIKNKWNTHFGCKLWCKALLTNNERLERVKQVFNSQPRHQPFNPPVWSKQEIIKPGMYPTVKVSPSPVCINMWRPGTSKRVHAKFVFQHPRLVKAIFPARSRHQAVIRTIA